MNSETTPVFREREIAQKCNNFHQACPLCGSKEIFDLHNIDGFIIAACRGCSLKFTKNIVSDEILTEYYSTISDYDSEKNVYIDETNKNYLSYAHENLANKIKNTFSLSSNKLTILDIGCASGDFFRFFPNWETYGVELDPEKAAHAAQKCQHIYNGDFKTAPFPQNFFDVITAQDCLDHSNDPLSTLQHCSMLAKPGALIAIKVHNFSCLLAKLSGSKFYALTPPGHLCYFNLPTLKLILEKCGFKYSSHFYNTQKLKLSTAISRAYQGSPHGAGRVVFNLVNKYPALNWPLYKNFHDIITVFGKKI